AFDFPCTDLISCFRASSRIFTIVIFSSSFQSMMLILLQKSDDTQIPPPESTRPSIRLWVQLKVGGKVLRALRHLLECGSWVPPWWTERASSAPLSRKYRFGQSVAPLLPDP